MRKGRALQTISNTVLDITITLARADQPLYILEDLGDAYEVATVDEPMNTFYAAKSQVEVISDSVH